MLCDPRQGNSMYSVVQSNFIMGFFSWGEMDDGISVPCFHTHLDMLPLKTELESGPGQGKSQLPSVAHSHPSLNQPGHQSSGTGSHGSGALSLC